MEEDFQDFPCWKVTHFVWMIAWGCRIHMGIMVPNTFQIPFLKGTSRQHLIASLSTLLLHDDSYLANLHAWEEQCGDLLMIHSSYINVVDLVKLDYGHNHYALFTHESDRSSYFMVPFHIKMDFMFIQDKYGFLSPFILLLSAKDKNQYSY